MFYYSVGFQMLVFHFPKFYQTHVQDGWLTAHDDIPAILESYWNVKTYWKHCIAKFLVLLQKPEGYN